MNLSEAFDVLNGTTGEQYEAFRALRDAYTRAESANQRIGELEKAQP